MARHVYRKFVRGELRVLGVLRELGELRELEVIRAIGELGTIRELRAIGELRELPKPQQPPDKTTKQ